MSGGFVKRLRFGQLGESLIGRWCIWRGQGVLPVYETEIDSGKGPRFFTPRGQFAAPDMFVLPAACWVEGKHKSVFTWHRITKRWCTGIDLNHYKDYQQTQEISARPVWVLFLHRLSTPAQCDLRHGCPSTCPTGLFGASLKHLVANESHRHANGSRHGMVYWAVESLTKLDELDDVISVAEAAE